MQHDYSQPDFYHFSEDSLALVDEVCRHFSSEKLVIEILDIGAGCGVMGLELFKRIPHEVHLTLLEPQIEFHSHIQKNCKKFGNDHMDIFRYKLGDFVRVIDKKYDLIVANPPYFNLTSSRPNPHPQRNACRRSLWENCETWPKVVQNSLLKTGGQYYYLSRTLIPAGGVMLRDLGKTGVYSLVNSEVA